jgi:ornithine cyclodeaminase
MATDALARQGASTLVIFGCGTQAEAHLKAIPIVRPIRRALVWGRSSSSAREFARRIDYDLDFEVVAVTDAKEAAEEADIICTVTGAAEPILFRDWVKPGTHINAVGSSHAGPVEIDPGLVAATAYFAEYGRSARVAAAELIRAQELGLVGDDHIRAEIGEVLNGTATGRLNDAEITLYKSLGHIVQDLAAVSYLHRRAAV